MAFSRRAATLEPDSRRAIRRSTTGATRSPATAHAPHQACLRLLRHAEDPLPVPSPVLGEIGYLLQSRAGPRAEVTFLRSSGGDGFKAAGLQGTGRMAGLTGTNL
jgi:hypothetical protein